MIYRELQQVHAGARSRKPGLIASAITDAESRVQVSKAEQWGSRRTRDEFEHPFPFGVFHAFHDPPKKCYGRMFLSVVSDGVDATILCVVSKVVDRDLRAGPAGEGLQLRLIEHA